MSLVRKLLLAADKLRWWMSTLRAKSAGERHRWERQAGQGDAEAAFQLGEWFRRKRYFRIAGRWYQYAAESGHAEAAHALGSVLYRDGFKKQARAWHLRAARLGVEQGKPAATVANYLRFGDQPEQALQVLREAAESGDADAAMSLGRQLSGSAGRPGEAEKYYRMAFDLGRVDAGVPLGRILAGEGRIHEAEQYFRPAADQGDAEAAREFGLLAWKAGSDQAERYLRTAAWNDPSGQGVLALAEFLLGKGHTDDAVRCLLNGFGPEAKLLTAHAGANLLRRAGRHKAADDFDERSGWNRLQRNMDALDRALDD